MDDWPHCPRRAVAKGEFHQPLLPEGHQAVTGVCHHSRLVATGDLRRCRLQAIPKDECRQLNRAERAEYRQQSVVVKGEFHRPLPVAKVACRPHLPVGYWQSFGLIAMIRLPSHGPRELARMFAPTRRRCALDFGPAATFAGWWTD